MTLIESWGIILYMNEINLLLQEAADADREAQLDFEYELFLEEMHYYWSCECDEWDLELELYNELG